MQKSIVIASILKPVSDTRMYEKFAQTLSMNSKYKVIIVGFASKKIPIGEGITLVPLFQFSRLSVQRLLAQFRFFFFLTNTKPDLVIINTHELLGIAILAKYIYGIKVIYDVRENYFRNVAYGRSLPILIRWPLALAIRLTESFYSLFADFFFIAEAGYAKELPFIKSKFVVLENKVSKLVINKIPITRNPSDNKFLVCGTISEEYGIFEAIDFVSKLRTRIPEASLKIVGYCANGRLWKKIAKRIAGLEYVAVIGGDELVPHEIVLHSMAETNYILMPYGNLPQIRHCFPTKIFEAVALNCPILISYGEIWNNFITNYSAGLLVDFHQVIPIEVIHEARSHQFYPHSTPDTIYWETQENLLQKAVIKLF